MERREAGPRSKRLRALDAVRGTAMLFVCLSHFGLEYFRPLGDPPVRLLMYNIGMVASPTFMLLSGIILGLVYRRRAGEISHLALTLADRGLFLLTAGHVLIVLACIPRMGSLAAAARLGFITDAIAVAILIGPFIVRRVPLRARLLLAVAVYVAAWAAIVLWTPAGRAAHALKAVLTGPTLGVETASIFPIVPWFAVYLAGTALGEWMAMLDTPADRRRLERGLLLASGGAIAVTVLGKLMLWGAIALGIASEYPVLHHLLSPWRKLPPSPLYLAFFGGCGLTIIALVMTAERRGIAERYMRVASLVGRNSLFIFLLQFYIYYVLVFYLRLPHSPLWPLYFIATLAVIVLAAWGWEARRMNRMLTVGLAWLRALELRREARVRAS